MVLSSGFLMQLNRHPGRVRQRHRPQQDGPHEPRGDGAHPPAPARDEPGRARRRGLLRPGALRGRPVDGRVPGVQFNRLFIFA